ncbi:hypothetical protein RZS28_18765 (plasmid) [Methylocapsa polymorpha]|uniref:Uncharacterized protein n=1 Tax=Methylocapsa polymorpha TaxID=3080828 RepID=A0ABZ0HYB2_9HYPH|nr:hypothetical protein [Methylocapsa sp. RX1]WOJ91772.1 hypothetical protein RZS28_18765 [Methylocapsa sp. RX1]
MSDPRDGNCGAPGSSQSVIWEGEGENWVAEPGKRAPGLDALLWWATQIGASRIAFQSAHPVRIRVHGRNSRATRKSLSEAEIGRIVNHLYGGDGAAWLQGGGDFDVIYEIGVGATRRIVFWANATSICVDRSARAKIVLRPIHDMRQSLEHVSSPASSGTDRFSASRGDEAA